jgi:predicted nucleotidyltransferase
MTVQDAVREHREEIRRIAAQHGATDVRVFGSVARGTAGPESDLDLLVDLGPCRPPWFPGGLIADLEELLGCHVDVATERTLHRRIRDRVLTEAHPL